MYKRRLRRTVTVDGGKCEVSPVLYHEEKTAHCGECSPERDTMEEMLLKNAMQLDKPILGIIKDAVREAAPECIKPILQRQQRCKDALGIACIAFAETS